MRRPQSPRQRRQRGIVLVVGDGESEKAYFDRLSDICVSVGIKAYATGKTGPDVLIRKTKEYARRHDLDPADGDLVAIVMDLDDRFTEEQISRMDKELSEMDYHLFLSNPSFEVWLLCHLRPLTHGYTPAELVEDLEKELGRPYKKSGGFDLDGRMVGTAIGNARRLLPDEVCDPVGCYRRNPSTTVHSLVEAILKRVGRRCPPAPSVRGIPCGTEWKDPMDRSDIERPRGMCWSETSSDRGVGPGFGKARPQMFRAGEPALRSANAELVSQSAMEIAVISATFI